jgi:hypothetical protein
MPALEDKEVLIDKSLICLFSNIVVRQDNISAYLIRFISLKSMSKVVVDPMCLLGISTYHEKNLPSNFGTSIGILYALQK